MQIELNLMKQHKRDDVDVGDAVAPPQRLRLRKGQSAADLAIDFLGVNRTTKRNMKITISKTKRVASGFLIWGQP